MKALTLPKQIAVKLYICANRGITGETEIRISDFDRSKIDSTYIPLRTYELVIDLSAADLLTAEVTSLRMTQQEIVDKAELQVEFIENQIQSLRCQEHKTDASTSDDEFDELPF